MSPAELAVWIVGALGLLGGIGSGVKAWVDHRATRSKAGLDDVSAAALLTNTAREMLDPLRQQLADVRAEHARERRTDRAQVRELRRELAACTAEAENLRGELAMARVVADELRRDREKYREKERLNAARIRDLERQLAGGGL